MTRSPPSNPSNASPQLRASSGAPRAGTPALAGRAAPLSSWSTLTTSATARRSVHCGQPVTSAAPVSRCDMNVRVGRLEGLLAACTGIQVLPCPLFAHAWRT